MSATIPLEALQPGKPQTAYEPIFNVTLKTTQLMNTTPPPSSTSSVNQNSQTTAPLLGTIALIWGLGGFFCLLLFAIYRLAPIAWNTLQEPLSPLQYVVLVVNSLFMAHSEGYKGFQKAYSPRVVARADYLRKHTTPLLTLLAPFFCMTYFAAPRKRILTSWILTVAIIILIIIFQRLPFPWRGILDAGVVIGLSWGIVSTGYFAWRVFVSGQAASDPEVV